MSGWPKHPVLYEINTWLWVAEMSAAAGAYTAARAQVLSKPRTKPPVVSPIDHAGLAGVSDHKVAQAAGRTWPEWMKVLDAEHASTMRHRDIAMLVHDVAPETDSVNYAPRVRIPTLC